MVVPQVLIADRYRLLHRVGSGGMGVVWEGWDERLERRVALKQLYRQSGASTSEAELANQRALREARLAARLQHPHAVPVFDAVEQDGQLWLVMQFIPSITLAAALEQGGPLLPNEATKVGAEVASALAAAHAVGIVHRDVKPGNILIAEDGAALISDFGIARALGDATLTSSGMIHGTPAYLAPEVARGSEANFASDVFSLGSTLYSALEGRPPFGTDDNTMALLHRVASGQFPPPQRSGPLTPMIMDMLATIPTSVRRWVPWRRFWHGCPQCGAPIPQVGGRARHNHSVAALEAGPEERDTLAAALAPPGHDHQPPDPRRRRGLAAAVVVVALIGIGIVVTTLLVNDRRAASPTVGPGQSSSAATATTSPPSRPSPTTDAPSPTPQSVRTTAGFSTETNATKQGSYAIPGSIADVCANRPRHAHRGGAQAGDHPLLHVDAAEHRCSLAADDGLVPNQPCRRAGGVPAILGCHQQGHGG